MTSPPVTYCETRYGFIWGAMDIQRVYSHRGAVCLALVTPRQEWRVKVTPSGIVRVEKQKRRKRERKG